MEDDFEVYAEDNFEAILKNLPATSTKWETFDKVANEDDEKVHIELHQDGSVERIATLRNDNHPSKVEKDGNVMIISFKKNGESSDLKELLRGLHNAKLHETTIIFHTNYDSLNEEEIDLLEVFNSHYKKFHIEYDDKEMPDDDLLNTSTDSDEEETTSYFHARSVAEDDNENEDEIVNVQEFRQEFNDMTVNSMENLISVRNSLKDMDYNDPRRVQLVEKMTEMISQLMDDDE